MNAISYRDIVGCKEQLVAPYRQFLRMCIAYEVLCFEFDNQAPQFYLFLSLSLSPPPSSFLSIYIYIQDVQSIPAIPAIFFIKITQRSPINTFALSFHVYFLDRLKTRRNPLVKGDIHALSIFSTTASSLLSPKETTNLHSVWYAYMFALCRSALMVW